PANLIIALGLALAVNRFRGWKRHSLAMLLFLPSVVTTVASAVTWRWLYCQQSPINVAINWLGFGPYNWLNDPDLALPSLILFSIWRSYGLSMLIIMSGLELINRELYEAVRIDGGSHWSEFRHVTLPGLRRTFFAITVGVVVANIQFFIEPYVLTGGGPKDATMSLLLFSYNKAFGSFQLGYASAVITVLFVFFVIFNIWQKNIRQKLSQ
ncbi:MAG: ABC transporter sugar permease, partial [uncultured bacterium]